MQLRDIQYAITVAEELSFSKAARKLFISQPALSQCIHRLELELGISLFVRENNIIRLTNSGELFVKDGMEILKMSTRLKQRISDSNKDYKEHHRIGISPFYSKYYLPRLIPAFSKYRPSISLDIVENHSAILEDLLMKEALDFCLMPLPITHVELEFQPLYEEQILFAIPKNHALNEQLTPALSNGMPFINLALACSEPFVFLKKIQKFCSMGINLCNEAGFIPHIVFESMNWDTVNALIATGMGVGFVPDILVESSSFNDKITYCRIMAKNTTRSYGVVYKKGQILLDDAIDFIRIVKLAFSTNDSD